MEKRSFKNMMGLLLLTLAAATFASCDSLIFDDLDDCKTVTPDPEPDPDPKPEPQVLDLRLNFTYDWNMKFADAFSHEVKTVNVRAYDENGALVLSRKASVSGEDYYMDVTNDLSINKKYDFYVWAEGTDRGTSWTYGTDETKPTGLTCTMATTANGEGQIARTEDLTPLFHGIITGQQFAEIYNTPQYITIPLKKNTNNIKVVLQQLNGNGLSKDDFTFTITDDNSRLDYDNSIIAADSLTYSPWSVYTGEAGIDEGETKVDALIAEFTVNRLVKEGHKPMLTVRNKANERIFSIPLIDYVLLVKGEYNKDMSDQEYLDRQDTYDMTFFLVNGNWVSSYIYINSWRVVLQNEYLHDGELH